MKKLMITLCHIIDWSLSATLSVHMPMSVGMILKQPIFKVATHLHWDTKVEMWPIIPFLKSEGIKTCWNLSQSINSFTRLSSEWLPPFWPLKDAVRGLHVLSNEGVKMAEKHQPQNFFSQGIQAIMQHWRKWIAHNGDKTEDWYVQFPCCLWNSMFPVLIWMTFVICYKYIITGAHLKIYIVFPCNK